MASRHLKNNESNLLINDTTIPADRHGQYDANIFCKSLFPNDREAAMTALLLVPCGASYISDVSDFLTILSKNMKIALTDLSSRLTWKDQKRVRGRRRSFGTTTTSFFQESSSSSFSNQDEPSVAEPSLQFSEEIVAAAVGNSLSSVAPSDDGGDDPDQRLIEKPIGFSIRNLSVLSDCDDDDDDDDDDDEVFSNMKEKVDKDSRRRRLVFESEPKKTSTKEKKKQRRTRFRSLTPVPRHRLIRDYGTVVNGLGTLLSALNGARETRDFGTLIRQTAMPYLKALQEAVICVGTNANHDNNMDGEDDDDVFNRQPERPNEELVSVSQRLRSRGKEPSQYDVSAIGKRALELYKSSHPGCTPPQRLATNAQGHEYVYNVYTPRICAYTIDLAISEQEMRKRPNVKRQRRRE